MMMFSGFLANFLADFALPRFWGRRFWRRCFISICFAALLAACGGAVEADYPDAPQQSATSDGGSVFTLFAPANENEKAPPTINKTPPRGLAVNADLWRAALDVVSFMPLAATDPIGGVIVTDWYNDPQNPNGRFKINVVITGRALRADAVRVGLYRQRKNGNLWVSANATPRTARQLENIILGRARDFVQARGNR